MQRLLNFYSWSADAVRDDLREYVAAELGDPGGVLIADETGFLKKGTTRAAGRRTGSPMGPRGRPGTRSCSLAISARVRPIHRAAPRARALQPDLVSRERSSVTGPAVREQLVGCLGPGKQPAALVLPGG